MPASGSAPVLRADAERRGRDAFRLRLAGHTWTEIAEAVGLSAASSAQRAARRYADSVPAIDRERMREESAQVLAMARAKALQGMAEDRSGAIADVVRVEQRLAALVGLDAPTEIAVHTPTQTELDQWVNMMVANVIPPQAFEEPDVIDGDIIDAEVGATADSWSTWSNKRTSDYVESTRRQ